MSFEYFYGGQSESFSFYRIPRQLVTGAEFRHLSTEAKLLYGMMLDRMGLSCPATAGLMIMTLGVHLLHH